MEVFGGEEYSQLEVLVLPQDRGGVVKKEIVEWTCFLIYSAVMMMMVIGLSLVFEVDYFTKFDFNNDTHLATCYEDDIPTKHYYDDKQV